MSALLINLYISTARPNVLAALRKACCGFQVAEHSDASYDRTSFHIAICATAKPKPAISLAQKAISLRCWDQNTSSHPHPALGLIDHIVVLPIGNATTEQASTAAIYIAKTLAGVNNLPVLTYGWADGHRRQRLSDLRRATPYFKGGKFLAGDTIDSSYGPNILKDENIGVVCIGSVPYHTNMNAQILTDDFSKVRRIAKSVRSLQGIESLALKHNNLVEVACNILMPNIVNSDVLEISIRESAKKENVEVGKVYTIGPTQEKVLDFVKSIKS